MRRIVLLAAALGVAGWPQIAAAQCWIRGAPTPEQLAGRQSPLDSVEGRIGGQTIKVCYGRPSARGRTMLGGENPFDQPWRLGANEATSIHLPFAAEIAGVRVEPGSYSIYAIPGTTEWQIVVNRLVQRWGIPIDSRVRAEDVGTGTVKPEPLSEPVEQFTIRFAPPSGNSTELIVEWETTRVRIPIRRAG